MRLKTLGIEVLKIFLISFFLFTAAFGVWFSLMAGDCGAVTTFRDIDFYLLLAGVFVFPAIFAATSLVALLRASLKRHSLLESATEFKWALIIVGGLASVLSVIGYAYMAIYGAHTRCSVSIGF